MRKAIPIGLIIIAVAVAASGQKPRSSDPRGSGLRRDDGRVLPHSLPVSAVNAANDYPEISPGSAVRVRAPINREATVNPDRSLPTQLDGVSIEIGGQAAEILQLWEAGALVIAPRDNLTAGGAVAVVVTTPGRQYRCLVKVRDVAPGIFRVFRSGSYQTWPMALYRTGDGAPDLVSDRPIAPTRGNLRTFVALVTTGVRRAQKIEALIDGRSVPVAGVSPFALPGEDYVAFELPEWLWGAGGLVKVVIVADGELSNPVWLRLASAFAEQP
jgi:uncharacterized protein (TIGR03437 family)